MLSSSLHALQPSLFGEIAPMMMTMEKTAMQVGVSVATVRNWVKTGYLASENGYILSDSVNTFVNKYAGTEKLNARANKRQKDEHNHALLSENIVKAVNAAVFDDKLWQTYESSLSESFRNKEGIYYTPENIVEDMMQSIGNVENKTFLDPCCGGGNFIMQALALGFKPENVYGFDTDLNAAEITRKRIKQKTGYVSSNIVNADFLTLRNGKARWDYIFTNPPWGKKLPKAERDRYATLYRSGKSIDTSSLFFCACLHVLNEGGKLGFLLPEAFFNISTFEDARKAALALKIERLTDYGKPFSGLLTKAHAIVLSKEKSANHCIRCELGNERFDRNVESFCRTPKHILNFWTKSETAEVIEHIFGTPHVTLKGNATWGLGVVTGGNDKVCQSVQSNGAVPIFRGQDITPDGLKTPSLFIAEADLAHCQQVAPLELYKAKEKLIYRFICNKLVFYCDTKQRYILNSANMLILDKNFPLTGQQLADLLNSDVMNFVFGSVFNTHKILRSDLELLPIHISYFMDNSKFDEQRYLDFLHIEKQNGAYCIKK